MPVMKSIGGVRPCDVSAYGAQSGPSISQKKGPDIRRAIQEDEDPSRAAYLFPARCELSCITRSGAGRKCRRAQAPPAGPAKRQERRPILPGQTCCTLQYSADGALEASTAASSAVIGSMATQIHDSWRGACGCTLRLLRSMVPIFRSCLIEDDLMALTPHADGLFQFSI